MELSVPDRDALRKSPLEQMGKSSRWR